MHSQLDPDLGGHVVAPPRVCAECGAPGLTDSPLYQAPPGTGVGDNWLCPRCTAALAQRILLGNRAQRRARFKAEGKKGDRNRKEKRR